MFIQTEQQTLSPLHAALGCDRRDIPDRWITAGDPPRCALRCSDWLTGAADLAPESVDLLYADPPFNTGSRQTAKAGDFDDSWPTVDAYIDWLRTRLQATLPAIKPTGNLLLHVDWRTSHHVRLLLDDLLGADRFVNHLIWSYGLGGSSPRRFARKHDDILFYCMDPKQYWFEAPMVPATSNRMAGQLKKATDVLDVPAINNMARERVGWPTQKPLALLKMLVGACCPTDGVVLDPCCGSGTTLVAAVDMERYGVGVDQSQTAIDVMMGRFESQGSRVAGAVPA
jgi:DNA modification methylase